MMTNDIQFSDGQAYERSMGAWSRLAGAAFLPFLNPPPGGRWLDVGCGNGAFTELILADCAPYSVDGIDPAEGQVAYARQRLNEARVRLHVAQADALPFEDASFDVVTMALVLFFVPNPGKAVAEMARVARPDGLVAAYSWDMLNGGFPFDAIQSALRDMGFNPPLPPSADASQMSVMRRLWSDAQLRQVRASVIEVNRAYADFEDLWTTSSLVASIRPILARMPDEQREELRLLLRERCPQNPDGSVSCRARANAIVGHR